MPASADTPAPAPAFQPWLPADDWAMLSDRRGPVLFLLVMGALVAVAEHNFLAAHCLVEGWSIAVAMLIFVFGRYTRHLTRDSYLEFMGFIYAGVGVLDAVHTLAYRGMGVFPQAATGNSAAQLWVAARALQAVGLLLTPWFSRRPWPPRLTAGVLVVYVCGVVLAVLSFEVFPACFVPGSGLTRFKIVSEVVICLLLLGAACSFYLHREAIGEEAAPLLIFSVVLTIASELVFTAYEDVYDTLNMLGHALKAVSFYCIYLLIVRKGLSEPLEFRRRAEQALRDQDRRLRLAMDCAHVGFWEWRADGQRVLADPRWLKLFADEGVDEGSLAVEPLARAVHPEDADQLQRRLTEHVAGRAPYAEAELRVRAVSGEQHWLQVRAYVVETDLAARPRRLVGFCQDISLRKQAEGEVHDLRVQLARAGRISMAGQFMAALAHEINQPLAAICSNARAARRFLAASPPNVAELPPILDDIAADGHRASEVVRRLRELIRTGRAAEPVEIDLHALLDGVLTLARHELAMHRVTVRTDVAPALPKLIADPIQVQQVLLNLVRNAVESMARSANPSREAQLHVSACREDNLLHLTVTDNGAGIAATDRDAVFQPFHTTRSGGLGMGLSICLGIVEAHRGRIWWTPNDGQGVTFHVLLPFTQDA